MAWGPEPFTGTQNYSDPDGVITTINAAMQAGHRLILAMTGGPAEMYTTEGKFDFGKWQRRLDRFNTPEVKQAVANGVAYGTIIGYQIIDEPETRRWGGNITKATIDEMASYAKAMFPTLPMGLNHGPPGYVWRASEQYKVLDYVLYQYNYFVTAGDVAAWRDASGPGSARRGDPDVCVEYPGWWSAGPEPKLQLQGSGAGRHWYVPAELSHDRKADSGLGSHSWYGRLRFSDVALRRGFHLAAGESGSVQGDCREAEGGTGP